LIHNETVAVVSASIHSITPPRLLHIACP